MAYNKYRLVSSQADAVNKAAVSNLLSIIYLFYIENEGDLSFDFVAKVPG